MQSLRWPPGCALCGASPPTARSSPDSLPPSLSFSGKLWFLSGSWIPLPPCAAWMLHRTGWFSEQTGERKKEKKSAGFPRIVQHRAHFPRSSPGTGFFLGISGASALAMAAPLGQEQGQQRRRGKGPQQPPTLARTGPCPVLSASFPSCPWSSEETHHLQDRAEIQEGPNRSPPCCSFFQF